MNVILFVSLCQAVATCRRRERTSLMLWFVVCNVGLGCALFFSSSMPAFPRHLAVCMGEMQVPIFSSLSWSSEIK